MRLVLVGLGAIALLALQSVPVAAWWDAGHMQIAYLAYKRLDQAVKEKADALLKLHPDYSRWTAGAPDEKTAKLHAFIHAATWPDDIRRRDSGYIRDSAYGATAGQNLGYADRNQHAYWHYIDTYFSPDGMPLPATAPVNALTQLKLLIATLPASSGAADDVRSYGLVWILHLVGDVHQPLHAVNRVTRHNANGDAGGSAELIIPANGETITLDNYWGRMFGGYSSPVGAILDADARGGLASVAVNELLGKIVDPQVWIDESVEVAKQVVYAAPVSLGPNAVMLTREYETNGRNIARTQAALAAVRLANVLNAALK